MPLHPEWRQFLELLLLPGWLSFFQFFPRQMPTLLWLIVFFLSLLPDATATPLHAEWCHFIRSFYWFLVVFFFPFFKPPFIATDAHTALVDCFLIVSRWCNFIWSFYWCQCPFGWLFLSLIVATTASRMMPLHPERHHVDCFLFCLVIVFGWLPMPPSWQPPHIVFFFNKHGTTPQKPKQTHKTTPSLCNNAQHQHHCRMCNAPAQCATPLQYAQCHSKTCNAMFFYFTIAIIFSKHTQGTMPRNDA